MSTANDLGIGQSAPSPLVLLGTANNQGTSEGVAGVVTPEVVDSVPASAALLYKMRGQDDGAPAPGYVTWVATLQDFAGTQSGTSIPAIVGTLIPGSVVEVSRWPNPA